MKANEIYHVYNRGNNCQPIFFERENYFYFLEKTKQFLCPNCDILSFSLMPNHFHFLIWANERTVKPYRPRCKRARNVIRKKPKVQMTYFSRGLKNLLSSYARGINKRFDRTGSLFQQNTKYKRTSSEFFTQDYSICCFNYIHNNPVVCGMVNSPDEYEFSSYRDYLKNNVDSICNLTLGRQVLSLNENNLIDFKSVELPPNILKKISHGKTYL